MNVGSETTHLFAYGRLLFKRLRPVHHDDNWRCRLRCDGGRPTRNQKPLSIGRNRVCVIATGVRCVHQSRLNNSGPAHSASYARTHVHRHKLTAYLVSHIEKLRPGSPFAHNPHSETCHLPTPDGNACT